MDFQAWVKNRMTQPSMADEVIELIRRAGPRGISYRQMYDQSQLSNQMLQGILQDLVAAGRVSAIGTNGATVYVAR